MTNTHEQSSAARLLAKAEQQAAVDWELVETTIWGRKYPHQEHKDIALKDRTCAYSLGSAFRICGSSRLFVSAAKSRLRMTLFRSLGETRCQLNLNN